MIRYVSITTEKVQDDTLNTLTQYHLIRAKVMSSKHYCDSLALTCQSYQGI